MQKVILAIALVSALGLSGCGGVAPMAASQQEITPPVIIITQVVTQIVPPTPIPMTDTPQPSPTPEPPTPTPTFDPASAPVYYPIKGCVASRLHVGDIAMVSRVGGPNGIRYGLDLQYDTIIAYAQPGTLLEIIAGPWCSHGWIVWMVRMADGTVGFTPEGDGNRYFLFPVQPRY